jgi:hypothetical protein
MKKLQIKASSLLSSLKEPGFVDCFKRPSSYNFEAETSGY